MNQNARQRGELFGDLVEPVAVAPGIHRCRRDAEVPPGAVFKEIVLLPAIELRVEGDLEPGHRGARDEMAARVEAHDLLQRAAIERLANRPRLVAELPQIGPAEVFHPDQPFLGIVMEDRGNAHAERVQKRGDLAIMPVLVPLVAVFDEDERAFAAHGDAVIFAVRPAFFQRLDADAVAEEFRKTGGGMVEKSVGDHGGI